MLASGRDYKGVPEFLDLAAQFSSNSSIQFELVLNDDKHAVMRYLDKKFVSRNVTVHSKPADTQPFYARASLVVNLSRPDQCIETFGMTLIEAMAFGIPVIAPPVGGPTEIITPDEQGYLVDCRDRQALYDTVVKLAFDAYLCFRLSEAARKRAGEYESSVFASRILEILKNEKREN